MTKSTKAATISLISTIIAGYLIGSFNEITNWSSAEAIGFNFGSLLVLFILGFGLYYFLNKEL